MRGLADANAPRVSIGADSVFPNPNYSSWEVGSVYENDDDICLLSFDPNEVDLTGLEAIDLVVSGTDPSEWDNEQVQVREREREIATTSASSARTFLFAG